MPRIPQQNAILIKVMNKNNSPIRMQPQPAIKIYSLAADFTPYMCEGEPECLVSLGYAIAIELCYSNLSYALARELSAATITSAD